MRSTLLCIGIIVFSLVLPPKARMAHAGSIGAQATTFASVSNGAVDTKTAMDPRSVNLSSSSLATYDSATAMVQVSGFNPIGPPLQFGAAVGALAIASIGDYSRGSAS